jgi:tetratricopeptide (TPR) repeat protein
MAGEIRDTPFSSTFTPNTGAVKPTNQNFPLIGTISIDEAQQRITAEPENPYAYLSLAVAYWDAGNSLDAEQAFNAALEHTENDSEFYIRVGDILMQRQLWLEAAKLYLGASRLENDPVPPELLDRTREAVYLAASDPKATELIGQLSGSRVSLDFVAIIQARHALSQGQLARAKASVRRLNDKNVELAELKLLEAEIAFVEGDQDLAINTLEGLLKDPATSRWVRQVAEYILNETKSGE